MKKVLAVVFIILFILLIGFLAARYFNFTKFPLPSVLKSSNSELPFYRSLDYARPKVKGAVDQNSKVLGTSATGDYVQYLPIPGKANFSSNQFNGTASINYPIKLPKGPGGLAPALSVNYSSAGVDGFMQGVDTKKMHYFMRQSGPLGLGWNLSAGEGSISVDTHDSEDPCLWTYKIVFPGGSGEMFKVDASGNRIAKCEWGHDPGDPSYYWKIKQQWIDTKSWRTEPEMFLKIEQGWASDLFAGDPDFSFTRTKWGEQNIDSANATYVEVERFDVWKVSTPDGSVFIFGNGKTPHHSQVRLASPENSGYYLFPWKLDHPQINSYKLYLSKNLFGQRIKYKYLARYTGWNNFDAGVSRSDLTEISYGPNKIKINYAAPRKDVEIVKDDGTYASVNEDSKEKSYVSVSFNAISSIEVFAANQLFRKYKFGYYDSWQDLNATWDLGCNYPYSGSGSFKVKGQYLANDNLPSYHLLLKEIEEEVSPGSSLPKQTFTYQNIPYDVNLYNGSRSCLDIKNNTVSDNRNSLYLKRADNGFGAVTEYFFDAKRISDRIYYPDGGSALDNDFTGFSCEKYCSGSTGAPKCIGDNVDCNHGAWIDQYEKWRNFGLKRARLNRMKVTDGLGNFAETVFDYENQEPVTVLSRLLSHDDHDARDFDFVGYPRVTIYAGKKNASVNMNDAKTWVSKSKNFYHQLLANTSCNKKDPRSGMTSLTQTFDEKGITNETIQYLRFKHAADTWMGTQESAWPAYDGEYCHDLPPRTLVLNLGSKQLSMKEGRAGVTSAPAPVVYQNNGSGKNCDVICAENQSRCASIGRDPAGLTGGWKTADYDKETAEYVCNDRQSGTCNLAMENKHFACDSRNANWTNCRCAPQGAFPEGVNSIIAECRQSPAPSFCSNLSFSKQYYDWIFGAVNNPENNHFGAVVKNETFLASKKMGSSESKYLSAGYSGNGPYFLNKPIETWVNNPDNPSDSQKYQWQKMSYDQKGVLTKTESFLADSSLTGRSETLNFDEWGNPLKTALWLKDESLIKKQVLTETIFDATFHALPIEIKTSASDNSAPTQTVKTTYDLRLQLPLEVTDANNKKARSEFDTLGRLTKIFKEGDSAPSIEFEYHFNENGTYGVPVAVKTKTRTEKNTGDQNKILASFDLLDGWGQKVQSQSLINGKVMTSWSDQHADSLSMVGIKTFQTEQFVSGEAFGRLTKTYPSGTKVSDETGNLNGSFKKSVDGNGNVSYSLTNADTLTSKTIAPNGVYGLSISDPANRTTTAIVCKDKGATDEATIMNEMWNGSCPTQNKITSRTISHFLGGVKQTIDNAGVVLTATDFDSQGRPVKTDDKDLGVSTIEARDLAGNVLKTKNGADVTLETLFDGLNRAVEQKANGTTRAKMHYDTFWNNHDCGVSLGRLCAKEEWDNFGNQIKKYYRNDDFGRVVEERINYGGTLSQKFGTEDFATQTQFDNIDRVVAITYPKFADIGAETVRYSYQGPYLKTLVGDKTYVADTLYDDLGRVVRRDLGNGKSEEYSYNNERRLAQIKVAGAMDYNYTYENSTGNILKVEDKVLSDRTMEYTYDNLLRLTRAWNGSENNTYAYDDLNNIVSKNEAGQNLSFSYNASFPYHGIKQINAGPNVSYDAIGRMTQYEISGNYKNTISEFDALSGKPQKITHNGASETYYYDAAGNRFAKDNVLYVNQYLEKDLTTGAVRKNYFADGKLVAIRVLGGIAPTPTATATPTGAPPATPTPGLHCLPLGDFDCSTKVDSIDLNFLLTSFQTPETKGDLDDSGKINALDFATLMNNFAVGIVPTSPPSLPPSSPSPTPNLPTATATPPLPTSTPSPTAALPTPTPLASFSFANDYVPPEYISGGWQKEDLAMTKTTDGNGTLILIKQNVAVRTSHMLGMMYSAPAGYKIKRVEFDFDANYDKSLFVAGMDYPGKWMHWQVSTIGGGQHAALDVPSVDWVGFGLYPNGGPVASPFDNWHFRVKNVKITF